MVSPVPTRGALRALRGGLLATTSAALAVAAHTLGGGAPPDTALTILLTVLLAWAGISCASRQRGALAIGAALAFSQLVLHALFTSLDGQQHAPMAHENMAMAGMDMTGAHSMAMTGAASMAMTGADAVTMTGAHTLATMLTALLLANAESAVFAVAAALAALLLPPPAIPPLVPTPPRAVPVPALAPRPVLDVLLCTAIARRGPPPAPRSRCQHSRSAPALTAAQSWRRSNVNTAHQRPAGRQVDGTHRR